MGTSVKRFKPARSFEKVSIAVFLAAGLLTISLGLLPRADPTSDVEDPSIEVFAYNMPHQGWAPLEVYFSAFGTRDPNGTIVRYEWDLDGNGSFETDATSTRGYTSYTYAKPGEYTVSLRVTSGNGGSATTSVSLSVRHPSSSSVDYWSIFDQTRVRTVVFEISTTNWNLMWAEPSAKVKVEADMVIFGQRVESIGLSMKGNASLDASGDKKPWKVDTDLFIPNQEFENLKQLLFHNNFGDASMLRETLAYEMMGFAGLPTSHVSFVEIYVDLTDDDQEPLYWGVYTMLERPDRKYLANRYGRDYRHGNLYKAYAWFEQGAVDFVYYGPTIDDYPRPRGKYAYNPETNVEDHDFSDIIELTYVIDGVDYETPADFASALEQVLDVQSYLRFQAVNFTLLNLDTHPYTGNNLYLYHNPATGLFEFLPWDLNNAWGHFGGGAEFPLFGSERSLGPVSYAPLFDHVFEVQQYRQDYAAYVDLLARNWFNAENVGRLAEEYQSLVWPYLTKESGDRGYTGPTAMFHLEMFESDRLGLVELTRERSAFLLAETAKLWPEE